MAHTWDHVHSSPQKMCPPQLILPLEAKHGTIQATLNLMYRLLFPKYRYGRKLPCLSNRLTHRRMDSCEGK